MNGLLFDSSFQTLVMSKILLVEDDTALAEIIQGWLSREKHQCEVVNDGTDARTRVKTYDYDIIILDWELPGCNGIDILKEYRNSGGTAPILMLTGRSDITDKVTGFDTGADDYLTKPFHARELTARIAALLRRPHGHPDESATIDRFQLDRKAGVLKIGEKKIQLLPKELALMEFLMKHPRELFSPETLLNRVWPTESESTDMAIRSCVKRLRQKLAAENETDIVRNVHGHGYGFFPD